MFKHQLDQHTELRILEPRHAGEFLELLRSERQHLGTYLDWAVSIDTPEAARGWLQRSVTRYAEDGLPWMGIWLDGVMVGGLLWFPVDKMTRSTEIGYWLSSQATGKGIMTKAVKVALHYAFEVLNLNRVGLSAEPDNAASRAIAERLGFVFEGVKRAAWIRAPRDGKAERFVDLAVYAMLHSDWELQKKISIN
jgi:ribosomal-protein-serine acetyltransferase